MMILDGIKIKNLILDEVKEEVIELGVKLKLVIIQVGNENASDVYVKQKFNMCNYVGYDFHHIKLDSDIDTEYLVSLINDLNDDDSVTGILVQLPLPNGIDNDKVLNTISYLKDVDGLSNINKEKLVNVEDGLFSCTPLGVMELLNRYNISVDGKNVVILGRSELVGKPLSTMIRNKGGNVTVCHSKTEDIFMYTKNADIIISAVGKIKVLTGNMVRDGAIVIDVGINRCENGICGDVDFESVKDKCSYITPVPGGVGPMTVAMLAKNVTKAYKLQKKNRNQM